MSRKPKQPAPRKQLITSVKPEESPGHAVGRALASPSNAAARVMHAVERPDGLQAQIDLPDLSDVLRERAEAVQAGDLSGIEAMLNGQATALQSLFVRLAERAMTCETAPGFEVNMRMALRAQNQARTTMETLATIKNPPVVFARQANIANGPQQVNNGIAHAENEKPQTELLEGVTHERMDARTAGTAGRSDTAMETVGASNRPAHRHR
ncbi:MAG: hypothetical protein QM599_03105 [Pseudoxanthomonas sp.]